MGRPIPQNQQREYSQLMNDVITRIQNWQQLASSVAFGNNDTDTLKAIHDACVKLANDLKGKSNEKPHTLPTWRPISIACCLLWNRRNSCWRTANSKTRNRAPIGYLPCIRWSGPDIVLQGIRRTTTRQGPDVPDTN